MSMDQAVKDRIKERQGQDAESFRSMEKHPRCAMLPSPEKLDESIGSRGSDKTDTLGDFELIKDWVTKAGLLNPEFYGNARERREHLEKCDFGSLIQLAFSRAFAAMRNTDDPELPELVFWYYAGHGLGKKSAEKLVYSSTPCLDRVDLNPKYNDVANAFVKEGRKVKGGELFLHKVGFCDLYGLLKPWIAAVVSESINAEDIKKNKHLVIILDSCHSGIIAQELNEFKEEIEKKDSHPLKNGNSVTIQAACGPEERTFGGYFTPCFVYLNDPVNRGLLDKWKSEWGGMTEGERNEYTSIDLPSPMVVTTRPQSIGVTMEVEVQDFKLTLFQDPGFFKFCSFQVYQHQDVKLMGNDRALSHSSAKRFMGSPSFTVLDYKLKPYQGNGPSDPNAGTPMGLFLLEDPDDKARAVCAHIHYPSGNTKWKGFKRINLVHHKKPRIGSTLYMEDHDGLSKSQINKNKHKIEVRANPNAGTLVQACYDYVEGVEPGRWADVSKWDMTGKDCLGVNKLFRMRERSAWEDSYLKYIEKFDLPKVSC